jgi:hypothetical protein
LAVGSCGDDVTGTTRNLQLSLSRLTGSDLCGLRLRAGGSAEAYVTVVRPPDFAGPVEVTASPLPAGVTADALTIDTDRRTGVLTLRAAPLVGQFNVALTVSASGDNVGRGQATTELTVLGGSVSLAQGDTAAVDSTINRAMLQGCGSDVG